MTAHVRRFRRWRSNWKSGVIYVFEVQTKSSIYSLILNLLKSLNNPAVQGIVAVSDATQLEKIKKEASEVKGLGDKLKYWEYTEVVRWCADGA